MRGDEKQIGLLAWGKGKSTKKEIPKDCFSFGGLSGEE
jgi:hypothetical protein